MAIILNKSDYDKMCRTCLEYRSNLIKIKEIGSEVFDILQSCIKVNIMKNEYLPENICEMCLNRINDILLFKKQCERVNDLLNQMSGNCTNNASHQENVFIEEINIKTENNPEIVTHERELFIENDNVTEIKDKNQIKVENLEIQLNPTNVLPESPEIIDNYENDYDDIEDSNQCSNVEAITESEITDSSSIKLIPTEELFHPDNCDINTFKCKICNHELSTIHTLRRHMKIHDQNRKFHVICKVCNKGFYETGQLTKHMRRHEGETRYNCEKCTKRFYELSALAVHMRKHRAAPIPCSGCNKTFMVQLQLDIHMKAAHNKKKFTCSHCSKSFDFASSLKVHEVIHAEDYRFKCTECDKAFTNELYLSTHKQRLHSGERNLVVCNICGKSVRHLNRHIGQVHNEKTFECSECDRKFSKNCHLEHHRKINHGNVDSSVKRPYLCSICGQQSASISALHYHHLHVHSNEKNYVCGICNKKFKSDINRDAHMKRHTTVGQYVCGICSKTFHQKITLSDHMRVHTGERPFACTVCGKTFNQRCALKTHMKVHGIFKKNE